MQTLSITLPRDFIFGEDSILKLGEVAGGLGTKALVILYDAPTRSELKRVVEEVLASADVEAVFHEAPLGEPTVEEADGGARRCKESNCDLVISIGGGSVMDMAKVIALLHSNPGRARDYQMGERTVQERALPHIAIPTTSGTGSEATKVAVLTNKDAGVKKSIAHQAIVPTVALLDPKLTLSLPPRLTALTGLDALSHAMESFVSLGANSFTEACGLKSIELVGKSLRQAVKSGGDLAARADVAMASYLGGVSLNAGVGAAHILAQPLGAATGVSHSEAIAILLPYVVEINWRYSVDKYALIFRTLGGDPGALPADEAALRCAELLFKLAEEVGISSRFRDHGLKRSDFPKVLDIVAKSTGHIKTNPRPVDNDLLTETLDRAL